MKLLPKGHHGGGASLIKMVEVQDGDTLYEIAHRYNTSVLALAACNNLRDVNHIRVGDQLQVVRFRTHKLEKETSLRGKRRRFFVDNGDTLGWISETFDIPVERIRRLNRHKIVGDGNLQAGQVLRLRGSSIGEIATDFALETSQILTRKQTVHRVTKIAREELKSRVLAARSSSSASSSTCNVSTTTTPSNIDLMMRGRQKKKDDENCDLSISSLSVGPENFEGDGNKENDGSRGNLFIDDSIYDHQLIMNNSHRPTRRQQQTHFSRFLDEMNKKSPRESTAPSATRSLKVLLKNRKRIDIDLKRSNLVVKMRSTLDARGKELLLHVESSSPRARAGMMQHSAMQICGSLGSFSSNIQEFWRPRIGVDQSVLLSNWNCALYSGTSMTIPAFQLLIRPASREEMYQQKRVTHLALPAPPMDTMRDVIAAGSAEHAMLEKVEPLELESDPQPSELTEEALEEDVQSECTTASRAKSGYESSSQNGDDFLDFVVRDVADDIFRAYQTPMSRNKRIMAMPPWMGEDEDESGSRLSGDSVVDSKDTSTSDGSSLSSGSERSRAVMRQWNRRETQMELTEKKRKSIFRRALRKMKKMLKRQLKKQKSRKAMQQNMLSPCWSA